ncbi:hypothetical protein AB0K64_29820 [Streptomyces sp. NPDC053741]
MHVTTLIDATTAWIIPEGAVEAGKAPSTRSYRRPIRPARGQKSTSVTWP